MIGLVGSRVMDKWRKICGGGEAGRETVVGKTVAEQRIMGMDDISLFVLPLCFSSFASFNLGQGKLFRMCDWNVNV